MYCATTTVSCSAHVHYHCWLDLTTHREAAPCICLHNCTPPPENWGPATTPNCLRNSWDWEVLLSSLSEASPQVYVDCVWQHPLVYSIHHWWSHCPLSPKLTHKLRPTSRIWMESTRHGVSIWNSISSRHTIHVSNSISYCTRAWSVCLELHVFQPWTTHFLPHPVQFPTCNSMSDNVILLEWAAYCSRLV